MSARHVHALLAAGVQDPRLIASWQHEPERLLRLGVEPGSIDLDALWKFAGLTVKVRHNGLRDPLPLSFRLMNVAGLEIEVFAAYASFRAADGAGFAPDTAGRIRDLIAFLANWLNRTRPAHAMLWDLIRHEAALAELAQPPANVVARHAELADRRISSSSIPKLRGELILHEMQFDPAAVAAALRQSKPPLDAVPTRQRYVAYWRPDDGEEVCIVELDAFGHSVLSLVDEQRSLSDLAQTLCGKRKPGRRFLQLIGQLADARMLAF